MPTRSIVRQNGWRGYGENRCEIIGVSGSWSLSFGLPALDPMGFLGDALGVLGALSITVILSYGFVFLLLKVEKETHRGKSVMLGGVDA